MTKDQHVLIFKIRNSVVSTSSAVNELGTYCKRRDPLERKSNEKNTDNTVKGPAEANFVTPEAMGSNNSLSSSERRYKYRSFTS